MRRIISKFKQVYGVSKLAPTFLSKLKFVSGFLWLSTRHRIKKNWENPIRLSLRYKGENFEFLAQFSTDVATLDEIFVKEDYKYEDVLDPKIIIDAGSNTGISVKYFRLKYPRAKIYAFEPDPAVFKFLAKNTEGDSLIATYNAALSDTDGSVDFYVHPKSNMVSSMQKRFENQIKISVPSYTISLFMQKAGLLHIDLFKFDVEGAEVKMFSKFDDTKAGFLIGELHTDLAHTTPKEFASFFPNHTEETRQISKERYITILRKA